MWTLDPCKGNIQQTAMWRCSKAFGKILATYLLWQSFLRLILCACNSANCILLCAQFEVKHKHILYQLWNSKNRTSSTLGGTFCKSQVQIVTSRGGGQIKYYHRQFAGFKITSPPLTHICLILSSPILSCISRIDIENWSRFVDWDQTWNLSRPSRPAVM